MSKEKVQKENTAKYHGLTRKKYKKLKKSSTRGIDKTETCKATSLEKAIIKYPRAYKTMPVLYKQINAKKDRYSKRTTLSGGTLNN